MGREEERKLDSKENQGKGWGKQAQKVQQLEAATSKNNSNVDGLFWSQERKAFSILYQKFNFIEIRIVPCGLLCLKP